MKQEEIAQIIALLKENKEFNEHAILLARQSTPDSLSPILNEIRNKMDAHGKKLDAHIVTHEVDVKDIKNDISILKTSVEPAVKAVNTANGVRGGVIWIAGLILASGAIWASILELKKWIKN